MRFAGGSGVGFRDIRVFGVRRWMVCVILMVAGCGRSFGPGYAPGPAILPPSALAAQRIAGCEAQQLAPLEGKHFTTLAEVPLRGNLRVLRPGQGLTREVLSDRLNVQVDEGGMMLRMFCG